MSSSSACQCVNCCPVSAPRPGFFKSMGQQTGVLLVSGLGVLAGLALNEAFTSLLDRIYPPTRRNQVVPKFVYAFAVLLISAIFIVLTSIALYSMKV